MGLTRQSIHPMDESKYSSEEYENATTMAPGQRIEDQQYPATSESPRGTDLAAAAGQGNMSARAASAAAPPGSASDSGRENVGGEAGEAPPPAVKSERQLAFADESGGVLAEITYSSRTHYSKQAGSGALPAGRACCVIM